MSAQELEPPADDVRPNDGDRREPSITAETGTAPVAAVTRIDDGMYRVEVDGRAEIVYVAGAPNQAWAYWNGRLFHGGETREPVRSYRTGRTDVPHAIAAPMPATVRKVLASPGARVKKGDTLIVLEAMKMELPLRAPADAVVVRLNCAEGDVVQPDAVLLELE